MPAKGREPTAEQTPGTPREIAASVGGALTGLTVAVVAGILFFQWAGGLTPYDIVTFGQRSALELEALGIWAVQVAAVAVGAPSGCWYALRRTHASAPTTTALLTIAWSWMLVTVALRAIPSRPGDPILLPYAFVAAIAGSAALARVTVQALRALRR